MREVKLLVDETRMFMMSKTCNRVLNGAPITWEQVMAEVQELKEARTIAGIQEEFADVLYFGYCYLESAKGINLPMVGAYSSIKKFKKRIDMWKLIFIEEGLFFDLKYLKNGSNYKKPEKVEQALALARADI